MKRLRKISVLLLLLLVLPFVACGKENDNGGDDNDQETKYLLSFDQHEMSIRVGAEEELSFSTNFDCEFEWESSNPNVATVEEGFVKGIAAGVTNITVKGIKDNKEYSDTIKVTVTQKGPSVFSVTIGDKVYSLAAGKPVSALLISLYGRTYEIKEGYAFEGWYIDPEFTVEFDVKSLLDKDITLFSKYRKTNDVYGVSMDINTTLKYNSTTTTLGNVVTISPAYNSSLSKFNLSDYTVVSLRYDIENEKYRVDKYQSGSYEVPFDGFLLAIKNSYDKVDTYLAKLKVGTLVDLNTYNVNTATKIYFDRKMDSGSVETYDSCNVGCSFASCYDFTYGKTLYSKNGDSKAYPASTTKVITAIAALKYASLDDTYKIAGELNVMNEGSSPSVAGLKKGQVWTLRQLLYAMLLPSGNDAAYSVAALAMDVKEPGNTYTDREKMDKFAELMNEVAAECGATNSHFMVPDGNSYYKSGGSASVPSLWDDRMTYHYTTANDMIKIAKYAFSMGGLAEVVSTASISLTIKSGENYSFTNTNQLLRSGGNHYDGCVGLKTGTTTPAGGCLISAVESDGRFIIAAIMKASDRYADSKAVYNMVFGK